MKHIQGKNNKTMRNMQYKTKNPWKTQEAGKHERKLK